MMATEQNKPSVMAKLMGLDYAPHQQQSVYGQQRVFSENYLRKSSSIGSREKKSSKARQKSRPKNKKNSTSKGSFDGMQGLKSAIVDSETSLIEERNNLAAKILGFRPNLKNVKHASKPLFVLDSHTTSGWEFKKQFLERSKRTKVSQDIWSSKRVCYHGDTPSVVLQLKQRSELGTGVTISSNDGWKDRSVTKLPMFKRFNVSCSSNAKFKKMPKGEMLSNSGRFNENISTNSEDPEVSSSSDVSFEKDLPSEAGFNYLSCLDIDDELPQNTGDTYQPSPKSVLEPDNSSSPEYGESISTDLHGLWMKLQILKSESEENHCDKSEIVALSDEDVTERSFSIVQNTRGIRCIGPKETQQLSYLVNLLNELGFHGDNVEISFERCMTNPVIFETLEKKYGSQTSWNKTDRRLLFDRINLALTETVRSNSLRRKMSTSLRRDILEEGLWEMLVSQQKEVNADLSKKAVGKESWLDFGDEVDTIVVEIEDFLFNELAAELVAI